MHICLPRIIRCLIYVKNWVYEDTMSPLYGIPPFSASLHLSTTLMFVWHYSIVYVHYFNQMYMSYKQFFFEMEDNLQPQHRLMHTALSELQISFSFRKQFCSALMHVILIIYYGFIRQVIPSRSIDA
jgi:hypothetical protein